VDEASGGATGVDLAGEGGEGGEAAGEDRLARRGVPLAEPEEEPGRRQLPAEARGPKGE
jgi:hypothetical protein